MSGFLVEYNRKTRDWKVTEFPGATGHREALLMRLERERNRESDDWEIASLNSVSLETIKKTHARYFEGRELQTA